MVNTSHYFRQSHGSCKWRIILNRALCLMVLSTLSLTSFASQLYRYKNDNGVLVLTQTLPAEYVDKGYDILNLKGRVIKSIPPALTPEEIQARDAALEAERLKQIAKQRQDLIDEELKQLFSHPNDAVRVLSRRVQDIQGVIEVKRSKIKSLENQILEEEAHAAERQRKGLGITEDSLQTLETLKKDINVTQTDIKNLYGELDKVLKEFDIKIKRLEIITGHPASDYPSVLKQATELIAP